MHQNPYVSQPPPMGFQMGSGAAPYPPPGGAPYPPPGGSPYHAPLQGGGGYMPPQQGYAPQEYAPAAGEF